MDSNILKILNKATKIAIKLKSVPDARKIHFSFLFKKNTIVSIGWNSYAKTHPLAQKFGHKSNNIHSELACILNLKSKTASDLRMINIRLNNKGEFRYSFPCKNCQKMLAYYGVKDIIYSTNEGFLHGKIQYIKRDIK